MFRLNHATLLGAILISLPNPGPALPFRPPQALVTCRCRTASGMKKQYAEAELA